MINVKEPNSSNKKKTINTVDNLKEEYDTPPSNSNGKNNRLIVIFGVAIAALVIIIAIAVTIFLKDDSSPSVSTEDTASTSDVGIPSYNHSEDSTTNGNAVYDEEGNLISENGIYDEDGNVIDNTAVDPGTPNYEESEKNQTTPKVYSSDDFIKDLNGVDISAVYNVKSRDYITDYVNYKARRALMDDGMELYWLDVTYHKKNYRVQVPFYYFKDLDDEGICRVEIELLTLENNAKVISYMQVVSEDYNRKN